MLTQNPTDRELIAQALDRLDWTNPNGLTFGQAQELITDARAALARMGGALEAADKVAIESDKMLVGETHHDPDCSMCKAVAAYRAARNSTNSPH
jgi:hypothetical protein